MLRGLGLLLPVLVLGGLLHSEVVLSWDCASFHVSWVLSGDENSPVATTDVSFCVTKYFYTEAKRLHPAVFRCYAMLMVCRYH